MTETEDLLLGWWILSCEGWLNPDFEEEIRCRGGFSLTCIVDRIERQNENEGCDGIYLFFICSVIVDCGTLSKLLETFPAISSSPSGFAIFYFLNFFKKNW